MVEKVTFQLDDVASSMMTVYKETDEISMEEAKSVYPHVQELRKTISKQNERFSNIDYADSEEIRMKFNKLLRLANRLEAKVQRQRYQDKEQESAPRYIKDKMRHNSQEMIKNASL